MDTKQKKMKTKRHMSINIRGFMQYMGKKKIKCLEHEDGVTMTDKEARDYLSLCLKEGKKLIPMADCEGFDYQKGCPGHPIE